MGILQTKRSATVAIAAVLVATWACVGDDPSAGTSDGGNGAESGGAGDGGTDATGGDDGSTDGASNDASDGGTSFCTGSTALFCADFDHANDVADGWTRLTISDSGTASASLSMTDFASSPRSAHFTLHATSISDGALLAATVATGGKRGVRASFKWKVQPIVYTDAGEGASYFVTVEENSTAANASIFHSQATSWFINVDPKDGSPYAVALPTGPTANKWIDVRIEVVFSNAATGSVVVYFDGTVAGSKSATKTSADTSTQTVTLKLGAHALTANGTPNLGAFVDNVTLDTL